MGKNDFDKRGKVFLIFSIGICSLTAYLELSGEYLQIEGSKLLLFVVLLFSTSVNAWRSLKDKRIYYAIGSIMMSITIVVFIIIPYIINII